MPRITIDPHHSLVPAAAMDALSHFAAPSVIAQAVESLERGQFGAWSRAVQDEAAGELRALAETYHGVVLP